MILRALLIAFLVVGCQMKPTHIEETETRPFAHVVDKSHRPLEINDNTVILDTRSAFEYGLNRVENSLPFTWEALSEDPSKGDILRDMHTAALRLALLGLEPTTPVLVVGKGGEGRAEEGRLAWTLLYLGFSDVQATSIGLLRKYWTQKPSPPARNVPTWTAEPKSSLVIDHQEFAALARDPKRRLAEHIWVIDVRSEAEYLGQAPVKVKTPDIGAINIPWSDFYDKQGRPSASLASKLELLKITPEDRIVIVSQRGVRSAAAAYALIALGFHHVQNYLEGWRAYN